MAARLDERRHQCALLDLSQTIPHCGFAYLSRTARPTKDEDRGSAPANSSPHDNALRRQCTIELLRSKSGPPHSPPRHLDCGFGARTTIARAYPLQRPAPPNVSAVSPGHRPTFVGDCRGFQRIIWDKVSSDVFVSMVKVRRVVHGAHSSLWALPLRDLDDGLSIHTRPGKIPTITHASKLAGDDRGVVVQLVDPRGDPSHPCRLGGERSHREHRRGCRDVENGIQVGVRGDRSRGAAVFGRH